MTEEQRNDGKSNLPDSPRRAEWQLPAGVTKATWDYVHTDRIANDYDAYFEFNDLFEFDLQCIRNTLEHDLHQPDTILLDLGAGTGRALVPLVKLGCQGIAIDLSQRMLEITNEKAQREELTIQCIRANLVELDGFADQSVSHAICLFSTLGMIRGAQNRLEMLKHVRRLLKPDGSLILHVHNFWYNLFDPFGPYWLIKNIIQASLDKDLERGDKYFPYRGLPKMFLHVFTKRELARLLHRSGFDSVSFLPLQQNRQGRLAHAWLLGGIRANGWIITCRS